jgi:hypothetical protein
MRDKRMKPSEKYTEGQWYGWNGGECPVHPETTVDVVAETSEGYATLYDRDFACVWYWSSNDKYSIIAFRVVKHHVEPKVIWVNEYDKNGWSVYQTKEEATKLAYKWATRVAVRYVETPE